MFIIVFRDIYIVYFLYYIDQQILFFVGYFL